VGTGSFSVKYINLITIIKRRKYLFVVKSVVTHICVKFVP
jgi:hypothetical protein